MPIETPSIETLFCDKRAWLVGVMVVFACFRLPGHHKETYGDGLRRFRLLLPL